MPLDLFSKSSISQRIPNDMQRRVVKELSQAKTKEECLKNAYLYLTKKYHGNRIRTGLKIHEVFIYDVKKLWKKNGFLHCTNLNYLLRIILIKSGHFTEEDIKLKWTLIWFFSPHQYVKVKVGDEWVNIDIWGHRYGIEYGDYAYGFQ